MPMIDVYAAAETFGDPHALAQKLASELMAIEQVPDIPMFRKNTAAFVHELPPSGISNVEGDSTYVRVQVLTNAGALDRAKQLAVVSRFSAIVGEAAGDPSLAERTWVLLTEAIEGGWAWPDTPTRTRSSSRPPGPRSPSFNRRGRPKPDGMNETSRLDPGESRTLRLTGRIRG
jgi:phenylpyruvate tautomerase PptA (4-oxalocrotonate tautomerase family)